MDTAEMRRVLQNLSERMQRQKMAKLRHEPPWLLEMQVKRKWITLYRFDDEAVATEQLILRRRLLRSVDWRLIHINEKQKEMEKQNV
jgi:hypothetical protein